ncbi:MAG: DNA/RNA non-specific endonuclease [Lentisphaeraceae bacterium]|nr:DNA/RNA non-specific endonuclease [Lentisphaeraceae bacterium]
MHSLTHSLYYFNPIKGIWAKLERYCRRWAVDNGNVHIITGPLIRPNYSSIGTNKVTVPQWYYKICVSIKNQKAIAFLLPNRKPQKNLEEFVVTIDKLEEVTGLDFLDKVPDTIEDKIEAVSNINDWAFTSPSIKTVSHGDPKPQSGEYWISSSSGKRHNSRCRWFQNSKGHRGPKSKGMACKVCGG